MFLYIQQTTEDTGILVRNPQQLSKAEIVAKALPFMGEDVHDWIGTGSYDHYRFKKALIAAGVEVVELEYLSMADLSIDTQHPSYVGVPELNSKAGIEKLVTYLKVIEEQTLTTV